MTGSEAIVHEFVVRLISCRAVDFGALQKAMSVNHVLITPHRGMCYGPWNDSLTSSREEAHRRDCVTD